jgi:alanine racemase
MDQITVDLTDVPEAAVGDDVTLIGRSGDVVQSADDVGDQAGTIAYDILTGLLPRVPRVYVQNSSTVGVARLGHYRPVDSP